MNRRKLAIGVVFGVVILTAGIAAAVLGGSQQDPVAVPEILPSASASPTVVSEDSHDAYGEQSRIIKREELSSQPLISRLPYDTRFWSLVYDGTENGKYKVTALVYYVPGVNDPDKAVAKQRPFIEKYVAGSKQPAGTYTLEIRAQGRD